MKIVVLGGAGAMGQVTVRDLANSDPVKEVVIADLSLEAANKLKAKIASPKVSVRQVNLKEPQELVAALTGAHAVVNCAPYYFNLAVMKAALAANCHYLDLGGLFHETQKQLKLDAEFKAKNLLAVLGMGAAPGMTNIMAAAAAHDLDQIDTIDIYAASVDMTECNHPFLPPYALDTIIDEYALEPMVFENGEFKAVPPMSGEVVLDLPKPVGSVSAFLTLHSEVATLPLVFKDKGVKLVTYRLGLPKDFHEKMKFLVDLGFGRSEALNIGGAEISPRKILAKMIELHPVPDSEPNDCEVIRVDVQGTKAGSKLMIRLETTVMSHPEWKISCGALDTGVPPSIVAQMIASGLIKDRGVLAPEVCVPPEPFFAELKKRTMVMQKSTHNVAAPATLARG